MSGTSWVSVSDQSPTSSGTRQDNATGSFNYTGPVFGLPSVQGTAGFWQRGDDVLDLRAGTFGLPMPLLIVGGALAAWWLWKRA